VLLRWGDGESSLAIGKSTSFQKASPQLGRELRSILRQRDARVTLCLPKPLLGRAPFSGSDDRFRRIWLLTALLMRIWVRRGSYGDAFLFRREGEIDGLKALSRLIATAQKIVVLSGDPSDIEIVNSMQPDAVLQHVKVPKQNAYSERDEIWRALTQVAKPDMLLLSAGPTGKCLASDLHLMWGRGTKIIDTGHLFQHLKSARL
jgi:hypothetical protein